MSMSKNLIDEKYPLVSFYLGESTDTEGRKISEIYSWDYERLEDTHNYIQWLFPLEERSNYNWSAPVLNEQQITIFRNSDELKSVLIKSFKLMLSFYGLMCVESETFIKIEKSSEFGKRKKVWITEENHNYLRITRILKSLRILGLEEYAKSFFDFLEELYNDEKEQIGIITFKFWQQALK